MSYIFGPINSRRFGLSLGIDLSPKTKSCNFDCLYCELKRSTPTDKISNPPRVSEIILELKKALDRFKDIEVITITSNGEPTLYPYLEELISKINLLKNRKKTLILSNSSLIYKKDIQKILKKIDIVKLSLDCATNRCFRQLDRPLKEISLKKIIDGMVEFSKNYNGSLVIEIMVVKGINDKEEEFEKIDEILQKIKPARVDISTVDRPPAYKVKPVSFEKLFELSKNIKNLPVTIARRDKEEALNKELSKEEIINTLKHRPFTKDDIKTLLSPNSIKIFNQLLKDGVIIKKDLSGVIFYDITQINIDKE